MNDLSHMSNLTNDKTITTTKNSLSKNIPKDTPTVGLGLSHQQNRAFRPEKIHSPRNFQQINTDFFNKQAVFLEIGAGKGKHAISYAVQNPSHYLIAVERTQEKFSAFVRQIKRHQQVDNSPVYSNECNAQNKNILANLQAIHADAVAWVVSAVPPKSLQGVFILYPNPEPNNANQRWLNMPFFEFLLSRICDGGKVVLASNITSYIDEAMTQAQTVWQIPVQKTLVPSHSKRTHFEIKYLARGEVCWQLDLLKPKGYQTRFDDRCSIDE